MGSDTASTTPPPEEEEVLACLCFLPFFLLLLLLPRCFSLSPPKALKTEGEVVEVAKAFNWPAGGYAAVLGWVLL
jgi:hypothetical protein